MKNEVQKKERSHSLLSFIAKHLTKKAIGVIVVIVAVGAIAFGVGSQLTMKTDTVELGFKDIGELATQAAYCTQIGYIDDARDIYGITIPFTQSKYIYSYDCIIKAGYDFGSIEISVDEENKTISVTLPEVKILSNEIDLDSFEVYHESESVFNKITLTEENQNLQQLRDDAQKNAIDNGLYENARENAEVLINAHLEQLFDLEEYTVTYTN